MGVFGSSGVRGVVNEDLTPAFVERLAASTGTEWDADRVAIGRDTRLSGPMFVNAAAAGFMSAGVNVELIGVLPTPALQDHIRRVGCHGCMITASHNPPEYNGVKLFAADSRELYGNGLERIEHAVERRARHRFRWDEIGEQRETGGVLRRYVDGILDSVDRSSIENADLTVAVDPGHGATCETTPRLCRELGCRVVTVNATPDGRFPARSPEPVPAVLEDLQRLVRASDADLGVAHDGDGDRAMFVDENGNTVDGDTLLAILASHLVEEEDTVVTAVNTSQRVVDAVREAGGSVERTAIGSAQVIERISRCQAAGKRVPVAGESNGGIFLPEMRPARDGAFVLAIMLGLVADCRLSSLVEDHQGYHIEKRVVSYGSPAERSQMLANIETVATEVDADVDRTDGVRVEYENGWVLARASGTEPVIRVTAEAHDRKNAKRYLERILAVIEYGG